MSKDKRATDGRPIRIREGYQGKPFPKGKKFRPPPGAAADVPTEKVGKPDVPAEEAGKKE